MELHVLAGSLARRPRQRALAILAEKQVQRRQPALQRLREQGGEQFPGVRRRRAEQAWPGMGVEGHGREPLRCSRAVALVGLGPGPVEDVLAPECVFT